MSFDCTYSGCGLPEWHPCLRLAPSHPSKPPRALLPRARNALTAASTPGKILSVFTAAGQPASALRGQIPSPHQLKENLPWEGERARRGGGIAAAPHPSKADGSPPLPDPPASTARAAGTRCPLRSSGGWKRQNLSLHDNLICLFVLQRKGEV